MAEGRRCERAWQREGGVRGLGDGGADVLRHRLSVAPVWRPLGAFRRTAVRNPLDTFLGSCLGIS
eukprot:132124-Chlamydomonas_euryale.AAC.1